jgi:hypothetical protein
MSGNPCGISPAFSSTGKGRLKIEDRRVPVSYQVGKREPGDGQKRDSPDFTSSSDRRPKGISNGDGTLEERFLSRFGVLKASLELREPRKKDFLHTMREFPPVRRLTR